MLGSALVVQRRPGIQSIAVGFAFVSTVALDVVLIPRFGGTGAALASTVSYLIGGVAVAIAYTRELQARGSILVPRRSDLRILCARLRIVASATPRHAPSPPEHR
jgi:Na+-driven multidrug efflux pump